MTFNKVIGTGGIGKGILFKLTGNHTLGREESRLAVLTDYKDYCKQHIILSYTGRLLKGKANVCAIGKIGKNSGDLLRAMKKDNIICDFVEVTADAPTMTSVCFLYEDGTGGNITASNSACEYVDEKYILDCLTKVRVDEKTAVIAAPEIPLPARLFFVKHSKNKGAFVAASFSGVEMSYPEVLESVKYIDLLSINYDEAKAAVKEGGDVINDCYRLLRTKNKNIMLAVTKGSEGAYTFHNNNAEKVHAIKSSVASTAGAGDAFLGAAVAGLALGLKFQKGRQDGYFGESPLSGAAELGTIAAHFAVQSADTISREFSVKSIKNFLRKNKINGDVFLNVL